MVGDMRDAWPNARVRKNASLIRTFHGFKGKYYILQLVMLLLTEVSEHDL